MVLSRRSFLAIALLAAAATVAQTNHERPKLEYGNAMNREKRQLAEGGKCRDWQIVQI